MNVLNTSISRIEEKSPLEGILLWVGDDLEKVDLEFRRNLKSNVPIIAAIGEHLLLSGGMRPVSWWEISSLQNASPCWWRMEIEKSFRQLPGLQPLWQKENLRS